MKTLVIFLLLALNFKISFGQINQYKIVYKGYINYNLYERDKKNVFTQTVITNQNYSVSWSSINELYKPINNDSTITIPASSDEKALLVYKNFIDNKCFFEFPADVLKISPPIFYDTLFPFNWVLTKIEKEIDGKKCFKALSIFRGRAYAAWYCPELPVFDGPWKFCGLPGLIVEVYDESRIMYWKLVSFQKTTEQVGEIPTSTIHFNELKKQLIKSFEKLKKSNETDVKVDPSCLSCSEKTTFKIETLENIYEN